MTFDRLVPRVAALGLVATVACVSDSGMAPLEPVMRAPLFRAAAKPGGAAGTGRHIVSFNGAVPAGFAA